MSKRFIKSTPEEVGEGVYDGSEWWLDTMRPINEKPGYIAVECYKDKDPNDFVKCENMQLLFTKTVPLGGMDRCINLKDLIVKRK